MFLKERDRFLMLIERIRMNFEGRKSIKNMDFLRGVMRKLNDECMGWYNLVKGFVFVFLKYRYFYYIFYRFVFFISVLVGFFWRMDIGILVVFYMMVGEIIEFLVVILNDFGYVLEFYLVFKRIDEVFNMEEENFGERIFIWVEGIELRNVLYGMILKNVNFKIFCGESVGIVGESGSGKMIFVNVIVCYYCLEEGKVLVNDIFVKEFGNLRRKIILVEINEFIFFGIVRENVIFWEEFDEEEFREVVSIVKVNLFLDEKIGFSYREVFLGEW